VSQGSEYRRCFAGMTTDFTGGEFINFMLELFFLVLAKYALISSNRCNYAITRQDRFTALFILHLRHVVTMSFIPFGKWEWE
jgi:hypothetical protein